jgi:hypothetical protein
LRADSTASRAFSAAGATVAVAVPTDAAAVAAALPYAVVSVLATVRGAAVRADAAPCAVVVIACALIAYSDAGRTDWGDGPGDEARAFFAMAAPRSIAYAALIAAATLSRPVRRAPATAGLALSYACAAATALAVFRSDDGSRWFSGLAYGAFLAAPSAFFWRVFSLSYADLPKALPRMALSATAKVGAALVLAAETWEARVATERTESSPSALLFCGIAACAAAVVTPTKRRLPEDGSAVA